MVMVLAYPLCSNTSPGTALAASRRCPYPAAAQFRRQKAKSYTGSLKIRSSLYNFCLSFGWKAGGGERLNGFA